MTAEYVEMLTTDELLEQRTLMVIESLVGRYEKGIIDEQSYVTAIDSVSRIVQNLVPDLEELVKEAQTVAREPMNARQVMLSGMIDKANKLILVQWEPGEKELKYVTVDGVKLSNIHVKRHAEKSALDAKQAFFKLADANRQFLYSRQQNT